MDTTIKYTDPDGNEWADWDSYKLLEIKYWQAMGALGHPQPYGTPETNLKCCFCQTSEEDTDRIHAKYTAAKEVIESIFDKLISRSR